MLENIKYRTVFCKDIGLRLLGFMTCFSVALLFPIGIVDAKPALTKPPLIKSALIKNALYNGVVLENKDWFLYSSAVRSLWAGIHDQGWQVRVLSGKGRYFYVSDGISYEGNKTVVEAMIGYQYIVRPFFLKLYVGPHYESHITSPLDRFNLLVGQKLGAKVQFEGWMDWGTDRNFIGLDGSFSTVEQNYQLTGKAGFAPLEKIQLGIEAEISGNTFSDRSFTGMFATYKWKPSTIFSVSLGAVETSLNQKGFSAKLKYDVKF